MDRLLRRGGLPFFLLLAATAAGCSDTAKPAAKTKPPMVVVSKPVHKVVTEYEDFTGHTEAVKMVTIRARATGYLTAVNFKDGDDVKEGKLLFEIDPAPYKAEVQRAQANLNQARVHHKRLEQDYRRAQSLLPRKGISREEFDKIAGDRDEAEAAVKVADANLRLAELNLGYCKVRAPLSGHVGKRQVDPGNLVKSDDTALATIVSRNPMYAVFDVDERTLHRIRQLIREGKIKSIREARVSVEMGLAGQTGYPFKGVLNFAENQVDPGTGTLRVRGTFDNPRHVLGSGSSVYTLDPGMFVRVRIQVGVPYPAILVAERALGTDQGRKFVYIVTADNEVEKRTVEVGTQQEGLRVIKKGLKGNERIIVSGLQRVRPKKKGEPAMKVDPRPADMPAHKGGAGPTVYFNRTGPAGKMISPGGKKG